MQTKFTSYKNFGKVYEIIEGEMVIRVTVDIGPRIIYYGTPDYNFMYEDIDRLSSRGGKFFDENFGKGAKWYNLGGHRLWKSPEDEASYSIDNTPVNVEEKSNGAKFYRKAEKTTGLIKEFEIEILENNKIKIEHKFTNMWEKPREVALWALTVLRPNGQVIVPLNNNDKGLLPARNYVYWSYSKYNDNRFNVLDNYLSINQSNKYEYPFKIGMFNENGRAGYFVDDMLFTKTFDVNYNGNYPDFSCNFECFTNDKIIECESLSELVILEKGESKTHTEVWQFEKAENLSQAIEILRKK